MGVHASRMPSGTAGETANDERVIARQGAVAAGLSAWDPGHAGIWV